MNTAKKSMVGLAMAALVQLAGSAADTYYLAVNDTLSVSSFANCLNWKNAGGQTSSETAGPLDPESSYVIRDGYAMFCLTAGETFGGKDLTVGEIGGKWGLLGCNRGTVTFPRDGLSLDQGLLRLLYAASRWVEVSGTITVEAPESSPFGIVAWYENCYVKFTDKLVGAAGTGLLVGKGYRGTAPETAADGLRFELTGDYSGYHGDVTVVSEHPVEESKYGYGVMLRPKTGTFDGKVTLETNGVLSPYDADSVITVGALDLRDGSSLRTVCDLNGRRCGSVSVTSSLAVEGTVVVTASYAPTFSTTGEPERLTLLTGPAGTRIDPARFRFLPDRSREPGIANFGTCPQRAHFEVGTDVASDRDTLFLVIDPVVRQTVSDAGGKDDVATGESSLTNAASWSDGRLPHADAHYYVGTLRMPSGSEEIAFPGLSVINAQQITFFGQGQGGTDRRITLPEVLMANGTLHMGQGARPLICGGPFRVCGESENASVIRSYYAEHRLKVAGEWVGGGVLKVSDVYGTSANAGDVELSGLNTNFTGRVKVTRSYYDGDETSKKAMRLFVTDGRNLGGPLQDFDFRALELSEYARIAVERDVTLGAGENRGVFVNGNAGFDCAEGSTLDVARTITANGRMFKTGAGTLRLSGELKFYDADANAPSDAVRSETDVLAVNEGTLEVGAAGSCDGLRIEIAAGTRIAIPVDTDPEGDLAKYGLRDVKCATPFVLASGMTSLPVAFTGAPRFAESSRERTNGVVTVANSAAAEVRAMLPAGIRVRGFGTADRVELPVPGADATTFAYVIGHKGLVIFAR